MKYFNQCTTLGEVKATYKKLAKENHPDRGGDTEIMKAINVEYAYATAHIINGAGFTKEKAEKEMRFSEIYREVLEKIIHLPSIIIELVGLWIWITGDTKPVKQQLHDAGFWWAPKKQAWYYRAPEFKVLRGGKKSLEEIRKRYGTEIVRREEKDKITSY